MASPARVDRQPAALRRDWSLTLHRYFDIIGNMKIKAALSALGALAQENRLAVFRLLVEHAPEGLPAGDIAERLGVAPTTLSFHLKELANAGMIAPRQDGRFIWYRAELGAMNDLIGYLTENCCSKSAVCDPACRPNAAPKPVAVPLPTVRKRKSS
jgi:ArsR family transcriptional regulator, arsenate/arsenite/antimonite-responsive transcriptional repressor